MAVCAACGTENRDKARYCRGCACALQPVQGAVAEEVAPAATTSRQRRQRTAGESPEARNPAAAGRPRRAVGVVMAVVVFGLGAAWWTMTQRAPASASPVAVVATADQTAQAVRPVPPTQATTSASGALPSETIATPTQAVASPNKGEVEREPRPAAERARTQRPAVRTAAPAPVAEPSVRQAEPVAAAPVEVAQAPAPPAPAPAQTVDQMCAGSSNFLTRDLCRARICRNGSYSGDPVCVRFREMEEESRRRLQ